MGVPVEVVESFTQSGCDIVGHPEVQGRGDESGDVGGVGEFVGESSVDEIGEALRGCYHAVSTVDVGESFEFGLVVNSTEDAIVGEGANIFGLDLDDYAAIGEGGATVGWRHAVYYLLAWSGHGRDDETARAHAEGVYSTAIDLCDEGVGCGWEVLSTAVGAMVLNFVDEVLWVFDAYAHCPCLGFEGNTLAE